MKEITLEEYTQALLNEKGRKEVIHDLKELMNSKGWKVLCLYLNQEKDALQIDMDDINKEMGFDELQKIRIRLYYIKDMLGMPETFIKDLSEIEDTEIPSEVY
ncbi:MAG: hypothetical protein PHE21_00085 [Candidatus Dojkabacteria bacterium]|nr:hypothetical protein [Candidatus Dojkabacteria bacterium]